MRRGIISSGNWLIDYVKIIDNLPQRNMLVNILDEKTSIGKMVPMMRKQDFMKDALQVFAEPYDKILFVLASGCNFRRMDEDGKSLPSDLEFFKLREEGIRNILTIVCGFDKINDQQIIIDIEDIDRNIKSYFNHS